MFCNNLFYLQFWKYFYRAHTHTHIDSLYISWISVDLILKVGYVIFHKFFRKLSRNRVPKQTCSQSAVGGVSTHDMEERAFSAQGGN